MIRIRYVQEEYEPLYRQKDDIELWGEVRDKVTTEGKAFPGVIVFNKIDDGAPVELTEQWQYYCAAINYGMQLRHVSALFGFFKADCNYMGLGNPSNPRADWLLRESLKEKNPAFDKVRTYIRSTMTGVRVGNNIIIRMFDGYKPPPLKPGRRYPRHPSEIRPEDYLFNPREHRVLFRVCNNIDPKGNIFPFDNGAIYSWTEEPNRPYTFLPHVSYVKIVYSLDNLVPVTEVQSPYLRRAK